MGSSGAKKPYLHRAAQRAGSRGRTPGGRGRWRRAPGGREPERMVAVVPNDADAPRARGGRRGLRRGAEHAQEGHRHAPGRGPPPRSSRAAGGHNHLHILREQEGRVLRAIGAGSSAGCGSRMARGPCRRSRQSAPSGMQAVSWRTAVRPPRPESNTPTGLVSWSSLLSQRSSARAISRRAAAAHAGRRPPELGIHADPT